MKKVLLLFALCCALIYTPLLSHCQTPRIYDLRGVGDTVKSKVTRQSSSVVDSLDIYAYHAPGEGLNLWRFKKGSFSSPPLQKKIFLYVTSLTTGSMYPVLQFKSGGGAVAWNGVNNDSPSFGVLDHSYVTNPYSYYYFAGDAGKGFLGYMYTPNYGFNYFNSGRKVLQYDSVGNVQVVQPTGVFTTYGQAKYNAPRPLLSLDYVYKQKADSLYLTSSSLVGYVPYSGSTTDLDLVTNHHGLYAEFSEIGHGSGFGAGLQASVFYNNDAAGSGVAVQAGDATHSAFSVQDYALSNSGRIYANIFGDGHAVFSGNVTAPNIASKVFTSNFTGQTAVTLFTFTSASSDSFYDFSGDLRVTSYTSGTLGAVYVTYTDVTNTSQTINLRYCSNVGALVSGVTGVSDNPVNTMRLYIKAGTTVTVGTGGNSNSSPVMTYSWYPLINRLP